MKEARGVPQRIAEPVVLRVTRNIKVNEADPESVLVCEAPGRTRCRGPLITSAKNLEGSEPAVCGVPGEFLAILRDGDIIEIFPDGRLRLLWETASRHNVLFLTDHCNSRCIMCPQKPEAHPQNYSQTALKVLTLLKESPALSFGITGGEPTLALEGLINILELSGKRFPGASIQLLTNGRRFADFGVTTQVVEASPPAVIFCIPLYADNDSEHDMITGAEGSFAETIGGIYNLTRYSRPIEIRVVIVRRNSERLGDLAHFLYWNFPFSAHIAFMAMETSGIASANLEKTWIEPKDYAPELERAMIYLRQRRMNVSIYNMPLCLIPERIRPSARDSISDWKKTFLPECAPCRMKQQCAGFFATSVRKPSFISPL